MSTDLEIGLTIPDIKHIISEALIGNDEHLAAMTILDFMTGTVKHCNICGASTEAVQERRLPSVIKYRTCNRCGLQYSKAARDHYYKQKAEKKIAKKRARILVRESA